MQKIAQNKWSIKLYAVWKQLTACEAASIGGTFIENGVTFIKLKDNNCWTKSSQGSAVWAGAPALCPPGTSLPSASQFDKLITAYGGGYTAGYGGDYGYYANTVAHFYHYYYKRETYSIICIRN